MNLSPGYGYGVRCFPGSTKVESMDKGLINISELKYGDYIKSYDLRQNKWIFSKFLLYLHQDNHIQAEYISVKTSSSRTLQISMYHLIATNRSNKIEFLFANELKINDTLIIDNEKNELIIQLNKLVDYGAYAPLLESGTISVNNILASCYANTKLHYFVHFLFQPIIKLSNYIDSSNLIEFNDSQLPDGVFWYAKIMFYLRDYIPLMNSFLVF